MPLTCISLRPVQTQGSAETCFANQPTHDAYKRFIEYFPGLVKTMMDVDFKLRMAGFDIFPWEGVGMKPWDITSGVKEIFVPPAHEHEAYVKIRDIIKKAHATLLAC